MQHNRYLLQILIKHFKKKARRTCGHFYRDLPFITEESVDKIDSARNSIEYA